MKIVSIGGGPAGLYFAILMKNQNPDHDITVVERNRPFDTFGWGVVFSDETLGHFEHADKATFDRITSEFAYWPDIDTYVHGECLRSTGHGFAGMSRKRLLNIFQERCQDLGVELVFDTGVDSLDAYQDADLILGADGLNSFVREHHRDHFKPTLDWRKCKFSWLGADFRLPAFTFIYEENEHGLFTVHAYPFEENRSTWIVECREETLKAAGLDNATDEETVAYCENLFAKYLNGQRLLSNNSIWRTFPTVKCETWIKDNIVLIGDSAHTAHFSIGSGTKLAMEDAIALADEFAKTDDVPTALEAYQDARWVDVAKLQKTAQTSLEWYENVGRYFHAQPAIQFTFNQLCRSKRITWENLRTRDPEFVAKATEWFHANNLHRDIVVEPPEYAREVESHMADARAKREPEPDDIPMPPVFAPYQLRDLTLANRLVVSPMCQYSYTDGTPNDWTLVHLGERAKGGAGLVMTEATHISPEGRITPGCAGMYTDEHQHAWARVVDFVHRHTKARIGMQLAHSGRKGSDGLPWSKQHPLPLDQGGWETISASAIPYDDGWHTPREATLADLEKVKQDFLQAVERADRAGFDWVELHYAHGYLLNSFISPLTNTRTDRYGGSLEARMAYPLELLAAARAIWPDHKPLSVRISATEWHPDGLTDDDRLEIARMLRDGGADIIDVSAGQVVSDQDPIYGRMFQTPFSDLIRNEAGIPTMAVGAIQTVDQADTILLSGRADLVMMARPHLADPYTLLHHASDVGHDAQYWPPQYLPAKPRR